MISLLAVAAAFVAPPSLGGAAAASRSAASAVTMRAVPGDKRVWVSFVKSKDAKPGTIVSGFQYGQEIAIVTTKNGKNFAITNKLPPTGQPATLGGVFDEVIVEPLTNTAFSLTTGRVQGTWCPSPLGKLIFSRICAPENVGVYPCRNQGGNIQVLINVNAKAQFESKYWRGILDAQGKVDGGYY